MSNVAIKGGATGTATYTIEAPTGNTDRTLVLPDEAGTVLTSASTNNFPAGSVLQVVQTVKTDAFTMTSATTETDITGLSVTITPSSTSSKILVMTTVHWSSASSSNGLLRLRRGTTEIGSSTVGTYNGFSAANQGVTDNRLVMPSNIMYLDSPSTTSATTYKVTAWVDSSVLFTVNRRANNADYGMSSHITVMEIAG